MRVEVLRAVREAQAAVRAEVPEWRDFTRLLLLVHGCGGREDAREAARELLAAFPPRPSRRKALARPAPGALQRRRTTREAGR